MRDTRARWCTAAIAALAFVAALPAVAQLQRLDSPSAFKRVVLGGLVEVELPRNWKYNDATFNAQLNTTSEAVGRAAGINVRQGDNEILVSGSLHDGKGQPIGQLRISARAGEVATQKQMRQIAAMPKSELEAELSVAAASARKEAEALNRIPNVKSRLREVRVDSSPGLTCIVTVFDSDYGHGPRVSTTWVCPAGTTTIKLSTLYAAANAPLVQPTLQHVRATLRLAR